MGRWAHISPFLLEQSEIGLNLRTHREWQALIHHQNRTETARASERAKHNRQELAIKLFPAFCFETMKLSLGDYYSWLNGTTTTRTVKWWSKLTTSVHYHREEDSFREIWHFSFGLRMLRTWLRPRSRRYRGHVWNKFSTVLNVLEKSNEAEGKDCNIRERDKQSWYESKHQASNISKINLSSVITSFQDLWHVACSEFGSIRLSCPLGSNN